MARNPARAPPTWFTGTLTGGGTGITGDGPPVIRPVYRVPAGADESRLDGTNPPILIALLRIAADSILLDDLVGAREQRG
jgi:hypothetical protein